MSFMRTAPLGFYLYFLSDRTSLIWYKYDTGKGREDREGKTRVVCVRADTQFRIFNERGTERGCFSDPGSNKYSVSVFIETIH